MQSIVTRLCSALAFLACSGSVHAAPWWLLQAQHSRLDLLLDLGERRLWLDNCQLSLPLLDYTENEGRVYAVAREKIKVEGFTVEQEIVLDLAQGRGRALLRNSVSASSVEVLLSVTQTGRGCGAGG
jgi:hypothetical protein